VAKFVVVPDDIEPRSGSNSSVDGDIVCHSHHWRTPDHLFKHYT